MQDSFGSSRLKLLNCETDAVTVCVSSLNKYTVWEVLSRMDDVDLSGVDLNVVGPHVLPQTLIRNKNVPGAFKVKNFKIIEFVGLKPRFYSMLIQCFECGNSYDGALCTTC